ncbi:MAG: radical SAM protein [Sulfuritalea sp.]|jgi:hypothetical protein|nr:radical SAM protein [Sulfuritalea sp.]
MPTSLLSVAARFVKSGLEVQLVDENVTKSEITGSVVGINVIGAPYINSAITILKRYQSLISNGVALVGGQGVRGLSTREFSSLFGINTIRGDDPTALATALARNISSKETTSLIPAYQLLPDTVLRGYLSGEFCFYLSQGCKFSCTFCAGERSQTNRAIAYGLISESYRQMDVTSEDLLFLAQKAKFFGLGELNIYLSNLDLFQTPELLYEFSRIAHHIRRKVPEVSIRMRGLSTVKSFLSCHKKNKRVVVSMVDAGLERVGFGIDGATPHVWKETKKPQQASQCIEAIMVSNKEYGLIPESLMVFGHNGADDENSLDASVRFVNETRTMYQSVPRPHVAKDIIPGNDGWKSAVFRPRIDYLLRTPSAFQLLDFTTLPSWLTHPDPHFRRRVSSAFLAICDFEDCLTKYTLPEDPEAVPSELEFAKSFNSGRYDI